MGIRDKADWKGGNGRGRERGEILNNGNKRQRQTGMEGMEEEER